jgi:hypothetical protein
MLLPCEVGGYPIGTASPNRNTGGKSGLLHIWLCGGKRPDVRRLYINRVSDLAVQPLRALDNALKPGDASGWKCF